MRKLKGLEDHISISIVNPYMLENGWTFEEADGVVADDINHSRFLYEVYKAAQDVYEKEVKALFTALDKLEADLAQADYLVGNRFTEADIRLFTTLVRFDAVYHGHFKCNLKRLVDYPNLWNYTKRIYNMLGIADTVNFDHIKTHYYGSHKTINPTGVIPLGPVLEWTL